jgi:COP9 signalosome complex subunit 7
MSELHSQLEPFLILARNTKGAAAAKVVLDATAAVSYCLRQLAADIPEQHIYLLPAHGRAEHPGGRLPYLSHCLPAQIASNPTYEKHNKLLHLFAYGTLSDYISGEHRRAPSLAWLTTAPDAYPPLTAAHLTKLKHLTLVSLALQRRVS